MPAHTQTLHIQAKDLTDAFEQLVVLLSRDENPLSAEALAKHFPGSTGTQIEHVLARQEWRPSNAWLRSADREIRGMIPIEELERLRDKQYGPALVAKDLTDAFQQLTNLLSPDPEKTLSLSKMSAHFGGSALSAIHRILHRDEWRPTDEWLERADAAVREIIPVEELKRLRERQYGPPTRKGVVVPERPKRPARKGAAAVAAPVKTKPPQASVKPAPKPATKERESAPKAVPVPQLGRSAGDTLRPAQEPPPSTLRRVASREDDTEQPVRPVMPPRERAPSREEAQPAVAAATAAVMAPPAEPPSVAATAAAREATPAAGQAADAGVGLLTDALPDLIRNAGDLTGADAVRYVLAASTLLRDLGALMPSRTALDAVNARAATLMVTSGLWDAAKPATGATDHAESLASQVSGLEAFVRLAPARFAAYQSMSREIEQIYAGSGVSSDFHSHVRLTLLRALALGAR